MVSGGEQGLILAICEWWGGGEQGLILAACGCGWLGAAEQWRRQSAVHCRLVLITCGGDIATEPLRCGLEACQYLRA
ncbi:hypothetical protein WN944_012991 [Citrus x changshan-huyou]|uniref:Uncharacterized protein n=1 Tax=Citrus x changshan-huyou TaxID=2935761 RepID=A0AAP0QHK2_9ROSI